MKNKFKKMTLNKKTTIIVGIVGFFNLIAPKIVLAQETITSKIFGSIGKDILITMGEAIRFVLNWALTAAAAVFEGVLSIGFNSEIMNVAKLGWRVTRDFSNMFFILFMIIIAFATILRIQQYGIKQLLPKIIIIALLINFSFIISAVIIDFSNITADFFIKEIKDKIGGDKKSIISATFADSLNMTGAFTTYTNCDEFKKQEIEKKCFSLKNAYKQAIPFLGPIFWNINKCISRGEEMFMECERYGAVTVKDQDFKNDATFLEVFLSTTVSSIVLLIAVFTLSAGAIMLLIRIIALWLLIVVVPFVFISYIMPGLRNIWKEWWSKFLKWCFFAPIYAFFIYMAMQIAAMRINVLIANTVQDTPSGNWGVFASSFVANPGEQIISYGIIIAFLIGGLITAQRLSIIGSKTAINLGQKWSKGAGRWVASKTTRYPKEIGAFAGARAMQDAGKFLKQIPGFGRFGRGLETKGTILRRKPEESKEMQAYEKTLDYKSEKNLLEDGKKLAGVMGLKNFKKAFSSGLLQKTDDREAVSSAIESFEIYGMLKEANELKQRRPSVIKDNTEREKTMKKAEAKGLHKEWRDQVFKGVPGQKAAETFAKIAPTISIAIERAKQMRSDAQEQYAKGLFANFVNNNNFTDDNNIKERNIFAALTGKINVAFTNTATGMVESPAMEKFINNMKPKDFTGIDLVSVKYIAEHMDASAAVEMGRYISAEMKKEFATVFNTKSTTFKDVLKKNAGWASFIS